MAFPLLRGGRNARRSCTLTATGFLLAAAALLTPLRAARADEADYSREVRLLIRWIEGKSFQGAPTNAGQVGTVESLFEDALATGSPLAYHILIRIAGSDPRLGRTYPVATRTIAERSLHGSPPANAVTPLQTRLIPRLRRYSADGQDILIETMAMLSTGATRYTIALALLEIAANGKASLAARAAALRELVRLDVPEVAPLALHSMSSRDRVQRLHAARVVSRIFREYTLRKKEDLQPGSGKSPMLDLAARRLLGELTVESDWQVQCAILGGLERWPMRSTIDGLVVWIAQPKIHPVARERGNEVLRALTGKYMPADTREGWAAWWEAERERFRAPRRKPAETSNRYATSARTFYGIPIRGKRILFVIDISGSMSGPKFERLRAELARALTGVKHRRAKFDIVLFTNSAKRWQESWIPVTDESVTAARRFVRTTRIGGGTDLLSGLHDAFGRFTSGDRRRGRGHLRPDQILMLTDAQHAGQTTIFDVLRRLRAYNLDQRTRIDVAWLDDGFGLGRELAQRIADENGGVMRQVLATR